MNSQMFVSFHTEAAFSSVSKLRSVRQVNPPAAQQELPVLRVGPLLIWPANSTSILTETLLFAMGKVAIL
jgi:hypothetical protein